MNIVPPVEETEVGIAPMIALLTVLGATRALAATGTGTMTVTVVGGVRAATVSIGGATAVNPMKLTAVEARVIALLAVSVSVSGTATTAQTASTTAARRARTAVTVNDVTDIVPIRQIRIAITSTTPAPDVATMIEDVMIVEAKSPLKMCTLISKSGHQSMYSLTLMSMAMSSSGTDSNGSARLSAS